MRTDAPPLKVERWCEYERVRAKEEGLRQRLGEDTPDIESGGRAETEKRDELEAKSAEAGAVDGGG